MLIFITSRAYLDLIFPDNSLFNRPMLLLDASLATWVEHSVFDPTL